MQFLIGLGGCRDAGCLAVVAALPVRCFAAVNSLMLIPAGSCTDPCESDVATRTAPLAARNRAAPRPTLPNPFDDDARPGKLVQRQTGDVLGEIPHHTRKDAGHALFARVVRICIPALAPPRWETCAPRRWRVQARCCRSPPERAPLPWLSRVAPPWQVRFRRRLSLSLHPLALPERLQRLPVKMH